MSDQVISGEPEAIAQTAATDASEGNLMPRTPAEGMSQVGENPASLGDLLHKIDGLENHIISLEQDTRLPEDEYSRRIGFEEGWSVAHEPASCGHARANWKDPSYDTPEYDGDEKCEFCAALAPSSPEPFQPYQRCMGSTGPLICRLISGHPGDCDLVPRHPSSPEPEAKRLVDAQAEDEGLWCRAETAMEAYVQQALRELHAAVEGGLDSQAPAQSEEKPDETKD